jgi:hypothetical protein
MKMFLNLKSYTLALFLAGSVFFTSCDRDKDPGTNAANEAEEISAVDNSNAENDFDDASDIENEVMDDNAIGGEINKSTKSGDKDVVKEFKCATVTISKLMDGDLVVGRKMVVNFGSEGCKIRERTRKGKIIITFTRGSQAEGQNNPWNIVGRKVTTTFDNYFVDGVKVEGTKEVTTTAFTNTSRTQTIVVFGPATGNRARLTFANAETHTWKSNRTRVYTFGTTPINFSDDTFIVTGSAEGTNRKGVNYTANISNALLWKVDCLFKRTARIPVQGIIAINTTNPTRSATVDFGNGDCDNLFTITVNGQSKTIDAGK